MRYFTATLLLIFSVAAQATNGYFPHGWGITAKGMGGVSIASPQDSIAAANNPAGMALIGHRVDFGFDSFSPHRTANLTGGAADQQLNGNGISSFVIPELGYNRPMGASTVGVSIFGNGGMNTSYGSGINLLGTGSAGVNLSQLFIAPTYTYKFGNQAVGVSLNIAYQQFEAKGIQNFDGASESPGSVSNQGQDTSSGFGASLGWIGTFNKLQLGANYRSITSMSEFDSYKGLFAEQGGFDIPSMYGVGLLYHVNDKLGVGMDVTRINYSDVPAINNPQSNLFAGNPLGSTNGPGFGWEDITVVKLGLFYKQSDAFTFRFGVNQGENPIPEKETLFNLLAPGVTETHVTLGGTYTTANKVDITFMYMVALAKEVNGKNSVPPGAPPGFGGGEANLKMNQSSFALAFGWHY